MNAETKTCQNCKNSFVIEPEDFQFYEKIKVPPPTWCPECRLVRRLILNNQRSLHRRACDLCGRGIISMYAADVHFPVYCPPCWWSDRWDPLQYEQDYDFNKPFFEQYRALRSKVPSASLLVRYQTISNSEYVNGGHNLKNCYLIFNSDYDENCMYGTEIENSQDCVDGMMLESCQLTYHSINCTRCYQTFFSRDCSDCQEVWFSENLVNCNHCFGCKNLKNKKYYIFNKPYTEEEYPRKVTELYTASQTTTGALVPRAGDLFTSLPNKFMHGTNNSDSTGDYINRSKRVQNTFAALESEDCKYCMWLIIKGSKDCYDYIQFGENAERIYETWGSGINANTIKFGAICVGDVRNMEYTQSAFGGSNLFGCISLRNKQYCILNKQYTKEEYEVLVPKIIQHMNDMPYADKQGMVYRYGEFFPLELSPFAYNETVAQEYFPLTKEKALGKGYRWRDPDTKSYVITKKPEDLPDHIKDVDDSVLQETIGCAHEGKCNEQCATAFKIIPDELQFYRRMNLPLPRLCPNCRHYERLKQRNPLKLWHRKCTCAGAKSQSGIYENTMKHFHNDQPCPNEFETSYAPDRPEIVYCEACYNAEVA